MLKYNKSYLGLPIIESSHIPATQDKIIPPSILNKQTGNILFRLFCKPPQPTIKKVEVVYMCDFSRLGFGMGGIKLIGNSNIIRYMTTTA